MIDNHLYNLLLQMTEEHKSLWRIKNHYLTDAGECGDCQPFWKKLEQDKEGQINELQQLIKSHLQ